MIYLHSPKHISLLFLHLFGGWDLWDLYQYRIDLYHLQRVSAWRAPIHLAGHLNILHDKSKQGKSEGCDSCDKPSNLVKLDSNNRFFWPVWSWNLMDYLEKQPGASSMLCHALCNISKPSVNSNWSYSPEMHNLGSKSIIFLYHAT